MVSLLNFINSQFFFFLFISALGFCFLVTALLMILTESAVHSILFLMFLFLYLTELSILLQMEFLGLIFLIVYIGAVCILMLFHIKLIKIFVHKFDNINNKELFLPFVFISILLPLFQLLTLIFEQPTNTLKENIFFYKVLFLETGYYGFYRNTINISNYISWVDLFDTFKLTQILGFFIYNLYFMYLLVGSIILLVAMIGSIFLTMVQKKKKKFQDLNKQIFIDISEIFIIK